MALWRLRSGWSDSCWLSLCADVGPAALCDAGVQGVSTIFPGSPPRSRRMYASRKRSKGTVSATRRVSSPVAARSASSAVASASGCTATVRGEIPRAAPGTAPGTVVTEVTNAPPSRTHPKARDPKSGRIHARVDPGLPLPANRGLEFGPGIHDRLSPQPARLTGLAFAHGRNHPGAASPGELHRKPADHPSRARHEHDVAPAHRRGLDEQPRREATDRQRAALWEADGFGQRRKDRGRHGDLLSERPHAHPRLRHEPKHATAVDGLAAAPSAWARAQMHGRPHVSSAASTAMSRLHHGA